MKEAIPMAKILVVYHSLSGNTRKMAEAVAEGAQAAGAEAVVKDGLEATIDDFLGCQGIALGSPDYFSDIAGGMKDFFDRTYYPSQGKVAGKPCAIFGSAGGPAATVVAALQKYARIFKLQEVTEPVAASGKPTDSVLDECRELGRKLTDAAAH